MATKKWSSAEEIVVRCSAKCSHSRASVGFLITHDIFENFILTFSYFPHNM